LIFPDYDGGSIVNLMSSIEAGLGGPADGYPPLAILPPEFVAEGEKIVLLAIDGLGYDYLSSREGAFKEYLIGAATSVCPATTASAVTTFLTGTAPQQHGFTGWFSWFREIGSVLAILPFRSRYGGDPLSGVSFTPASLCGSIPLFDRIPVKSNVVVPDWIAGSAFNIAFQDGARMWPYKGMEGLFGSILEATRTREGRSFTYAYWPDYDALAHEHGVQSPEVAQHFEQLDAAFGRFVKQLRGSGVRLIVTADHGFIDSPPERTILLSDHPEIADALVLPLCGEQRFAYCYVHPERTERFENYVRDRLSDYVELFSSSELIADGWFGRGDAHPELKERVGHFTLVMKENYKIKEWVLGEKHYRHIGVHGGVSREEMLVPLVLVES
jgi:predicted AlkP superfamily pyrophosphatase or phosphodiesterase